MHERGHRIRPGVEAQHVVAPHEERELVEDQMVVLGPDRVHDDEILLVILLRLGPLHPMGDVLERQRVEAEDRPELVQHRLLHLPLHMHPVYARHAERLFDLPHLRHLALGELLGIVRDEGHAGRHQKLTTSWGHSPWSGIASSSPPRAADSCAVKPGSTYRAAAQA